MVILPWQYLYHHSTTILVSMSPLLPPTPVRTILYLRMEAPAPVEKREILALKNGGPDLGKHLCSGRVLNVATIKIKIKIKVIKIKYAFMGFPKLRLIMPNSSVH